MTVKELIKIILDECDGDINKDVKFDRGIPVPIEEVFKIESGKSWLLFKEIKNA